MKSKSLTPVVLLLVLAIVLDSSAREPQKSPPPRPAIVSKIVRARDLGIPFEGTPGKFNAITDVTGVHVKPADVWHALDSAHGGALEEGSVGGGTGMICYEFKGGNGTASRKVEIRPEGADKNSSPQSFIVGVFLQANFGRRPQLTIAGVPVGKEIPGDVYKQESGSCIAVVATDAPLLPNQLKRLARRVSLGLARTGTISGNGSGDLFIAFSTANPNVVNPDQVTHQVQTVPNDLMDPIFAGVVQATEEAAVNALVDNDSMTGRDNHRVEALPHDRLGQIMNRRR